MSTNERIGVYICHCGSNIAQTVDCGALTEYAKTLPGVVVAKEYKYMCSDPGQDLIKKDVAENKLTRVVVSSCSPLMHEETFRTAVEDAGLNRFLFQMSNIREQVSWVHKDKVKATEKAKKLLRAAANRVLHQRPLERREVPVMPEVVVVGGGIAGIEAALRLADAGKKVHLVEKEPTIGGHMARFDKTFPTLDCAACILTPKMVSVGQHPNINLMVCSEVEEVSGYTGNFKVKVRKKATCVDNEKCVGCGVCWEKCPAKKISSEFEEGLANRTAIYIPFPQAVPKRPVIDRDNCIYFKTGKCKVCEKFCDRKAIDFEQKDEVVELTVGAVIAATGFETLDPRELPRYGYGRFDNVLSPLEFERMTNASGPTAGKVLLKDGTAPKSVAILHCIGSRDEKHLKHCSRVCCMYSLKFAHLVEEKTHAEITNFYIDIRAFGKGYEEFYHRLLKEGVTFVRGKAAEVTDVVEAPEEQGKLVVVAEDTLLGKVRRVPVDMVVLSTGLRARSDAGHMAHVLGISRSADGFFLERHPKLGPVDTPTEGIYLAGACQGPKDIPDSVAQGAAAAACALSLIVRGRVVLEPVTAEIDEKKCAGCKLCIANCPYSAIEYDEGKKVSVVIEALCKGCGTCVATCPSGAARQKNFEDAQISSEIVGILASM